MKKIKQFKINLRILLNKLKSYKKNKIVTK